MVVIFCEKINVQQKVTLFMGDSPSFFSKKGALEKRRQHSSFLYWRMPGMYGALRTESKIQRRQV
jgi:hypothetical protein